ncbi:MULTISPECIES: type II secretion system F family protein [Gordonibacter]|uniref:Type II secretion system F family protein n=1 Tax=Gordonibacter faecis TaxID=3047475 RepID=A0ABT7DK80_9ACTN|nr:type II secretion system F family protein [Gordonibacter sp. KGMB12511]MDJ1649924.1 type II secretion system F family protein [Gordonibacter sp. KGMB12511]
MAVFKYEGTSASGQQLSGVVEAFDEFEALEKAKVTCRVVSKITPVKERPSFLKQEIGSGKIKSKVIAIMCSQFAIIIASGMGMARCVELVAEQTSDKGLKAILDEVAEDVAAGHSLANSFESKGGAKLPILFYETIRAGEQAGTLDQSFDTLHKYYDKSSKTKAKVAQALTYPVFVIFIAIVVVAVMMVAVIPTFKNILSSYDAEMPLATQILINASDFMAANILWIVLVLAAVALGVKLWTKTERGRVAWSTFKLKLPALGRVAQLSNAAQYANTMSTLLASGLQMTHAVDVTAKVMDNYVMSQGVAKMTAKLEEGKQLGECMESVPFMPRPLIEMAAVGEETGSLEETLSTMGVFYDDETDRATQKALSKLEPAILIFIAVFAGYIVLSLYIAMFSIYGSM